MIGRFIYIFSAVFFIPVGVYTMINGWLFGVIALMVLGAGWGLGWIYQDMNKPYHDY